MAQEPTFRGIDPQAIEDFRKLVLDTLTRSVKCCPNCENFVKERCQLNGMLPPPTIIAFGCECFKLNNIPF